MTRSMLFASCLFSLVACGGGATDDAGADASHDSGGGDAGHDAGPADLGTDAGATDLGLDAGTTDLGLDAGTTDLGLDAGTTDLGTDAGTVDLGAPDLGTLTPMARCLGTGGTVSSSLCCLSAVDYPNNCLTGACGCAPTSSHMVATCNCPALHCFDPAMGCVTGP